MALATPGACWRDVDRRLPTVAASAATLFMTAVTSGKPSRARPAVRAVSISVSNILVGVGGSIKSTTAEMMWDASLAALFVAVYQSEKKLLIASSVLVSASQTHLEPQSRTTIRYHSQNIVQTT